MSHTVISPKKLIEVAIPLDQINEASAATKRKAPKGYPTTLHTWWAQRPLAAARAVIFSQLVHDPEDLWRLQNPGVEPNRQHRGHWTKTRERLFSIIEDLVKWENTTNEPVLEKARAEIRRSWQETCELNRTHPRAQEIFNPERMPGFHDPFAGGGAIPLEAQRLGLSASASDLNPVAVLLNKALIEFPPLFANRPPVHPAAASPLVSWRGANGLAEDIRRYGQWIHDEAVKRIGHLYPDIEVTKQMAAGRPDLEQYIGKRLQVVAWLWARTVRSPNPAFSQVEVPLASTFVLSTKAGKESYVVPVLSKNGYTFTVASGTPPVEAKAGTSFGKQKGFKCLMSQAPMSYEYIRQEALAGRMGQRLMAIVAEGKRSRVYLPPIESQESIVAKAVPSWKPDLKIPDQALGFRVQLYGMATFGDIFTNRQLVAMTTLSDLISEARDRILTDAIHAGLANDEVALEAGGQQARAYAEAISVYLAFAVSRVADYGCTVATWRTKDNAMRSMYSKQAIPMTWDFAEGSPLAGTSSGFLEAVKVVAKALLQKS